MGARRQGQEGALAPSGNDVKCFCTVVITAKRSVYQLFVHFHNLLLASGDFLPDPPAGNPSLEPAGELLSTDP